MLHSQFLDFWISFWTLTLVVTSSFQNKTALHSSSRHHHVIIISSLESYRGELCNKLWPEFCHGFFWQICQASFPLPYSHPPLPNPLLCCHPGGWRVNECFHQHLHRPRSGRSWGCLAPQAETPPRGEVRFWCNLRLSFLLQRFAPKELSTETFCWGSFFLESFLKKLIELILSSTVTYIRSKNPCKRSPSQVCSTKRPDVQHR